jgi:hypothetical protein
MKTLSLLSKSPSRLQLRSINLNANKPDVGAKRRRADDIYEDAHANATATVDKRANAPTSTPQQKQPSSRWDVNLPLPLKYELLANVFVALRQVSPPIPRNHKPLTRKP